MATYRITEHVSYTVEAESEDAALKKLLEANEPFEAFNGQVEERYVGLAGSAWVSSVGVD